MIAKKIDKFVCNLQQRICEHCSSAGVTMDEDFAVNNESSLFAELSFQDLGDVDKGADIAGLFFIKHLFFEL